MSMNYETHLMYPFAYDCLFALMARLVICITSPSKSES